MLLYLKNPKILRHSILLFQFSGLSHMLRMKGAIKLHSVVNLHCSEAQLLNSPFFMSSGSHLVTHLCRTLSSPALFVQTLECGPPGSSVRGNFQSRMLGPVAISSSRVSQGLNPRPRCLLRCRRMITP